MDVTTPPNTSGFDRKPTSKTNKKYRGRKPVGKKKAGLSHSHITPEIATYIVAGMLLFGAMQILDSITSGKTLSQTLRNAE